MVNFDQLRRADLPEGSEFFQVAPNVELYVRQWKPAEGKPVVAHVTLVHGLGEHINRYDHVGKKFAGNGIHLTGFDQRGFGRSCGARGDGDITDVTLSDIFAVMNKYAPEGVSRFIYGHSMGGLNTTMFIAKNRKAAGLVGGIISSPLYRAAFDPPAVKVAVGKFLSGVPWVNSITLPTELDASAISRDPEVVKIYQSDPFVHGYVSIRTANAFFNAGELVTNSLYKEITIPVLVVHGTADKLTSAKATEEVFPKFASEDKTLKIYEGSSHELHNEPEKEETIQLYVDWILARCNKAAAKL